MATSEQQKAEDSKVTLEALIGLKAGLGRGEVLKDQVQEALLAKEGHREVIAPPEQPPTPEDISTAYYRNQAVTAFQVAGPGPGHKWHVRGDECAVRLLLCAPNLGKIERVLKHKAQGETQWTETHQPYPIAKMGILVDAARRQERCDALVDQFSKSTPTKKKYTVLGHLLFCLRLTAQLWSDFLAFN